MSANNHWRLYQAANGCGPVLQPPRKEGTVEYKEVFTIAEVNELAAEGWKLHSRCSEHQTVYVMERKRGETAKQK